MPRTIQYTDTLVYYDGIEVFQGKDSSGSLYVGVLIDIRDDIGQYLVTSVSAGGLRELLSGSLDLRRLLLDSAQPEWYITDAVGDLSQPLLLEEQDHPLDDTDYLPDEGLFLSRDSLENEANLKDREPSRNGGSPRLRINLG